MAPRSVGTRQVPWCGHSCPHSPPCYVHHQYIDEDTLSPYKKVDFLLWPTINQPRKAIDFPSIYPKLPGFSANSRFSICPQPESVFVNAVAGRPSLSAMDRKTNNRHSPPSPPEMVAAARSYMGCDGESPTVRCWSRSQRNLHHVALENLPCLVGSFSAALPPPPFGQSGQGLTERWRLTN